jgi:hypothetical protein
MESGMKCTFVYTLALLLAGLLGGCSTELVNAPQLFKVKVDSLQHPSNVSPDDTVTIRLFGVIGGDGCHCFSHFEETPHPLRIDLIIWGKFFPAAACPDVMVYLDGKEFKFVSSERGMIHIRIHQPDGSILADSVLVQ